MKHICINVLGGFHIIMSIPVQAQYSVSIFAKVRVYYPGGGGGGIYNTYYYYSIIVVYNSKLIWSIRECRDIARSLMHFDW